MVSEIIKGADDKLFSFSSYIDKNGEAFAHFCRQKIRQNPPYFGVARISKSIELIPELRIKSEKIIRALSYKGIYHCEFKKDSITEEFKLIEINSRFILANNLFEKCGVNFAYIMYKDLIENKKIRINNYRKNIY
ncbi:MAG: hypothetical protein ACTSRG_24840 [Candidatus Helarchaeota archaeon]